MASAKVIFKALGMTVLNQFVDNIGVFVGSPVKRYIKSQIDYKPSSRFLSNSLLSERAVDGAIQGGIVPQNAYAKYAVPKGLPITGKRSLAIENDPHTIDNFNGKIESGYGKGTKTLISKEPVIVKLKGSTYVGRMNYHFHEADVAGPHYDIVVEDIPPGTKQFEINIPRGEGKGRYAFTTTDKGMIIVPMKDQGLVIKKPNYILKHTDFLTKVQEEPNAWIIEQKPDGSLGNAYIKEGRAYFRSHRDTGETYFDKLPGLEFLRNQSRLAIWRHLAPNPGLTGTILQGELVHPDGVSRVSGILNAMPALAQRTQKLRGNVTYHVWDITKFKGRDVSHRPYSERRELYENVISEIRLMNSNWYAINRMNIGDDPHKYYEGIISLPLPYGEGVVIKSTNAPRDTNFYKIKDFDAADVEIVAFVEGRPGSKYVGALGTLLVRDPVTNHLGEVGTGFTDAERQWIWAHRGQLEGAYVKIEMMEKTDSSFRAARFREFHESKGNNEFGLLMYAESLAGMDPDAALRTKYALINAR